MSATTRHMVLLSVLAVAVAGLLGMLALRLLRRRSLATVLLLASLTPVLGVTLAVLLSVREMFLSDHDSRVTLITVVTSAALSAVLSVLLGRRLGAQARALGDRLRDLAPTGEPAPDGAEDPEGHRVAARRPSTAELAELDRQLAQTRDRLDASRRRERELDLARRELVAFMSHDLRTPLAGLRALAEGLEDGVVEDPGPALAAMRRTVDRLTVLVDDLFELSRLTAGNPDRRFVAVGVAELVDEVAAVVDGLAREHAVRLEVTVPPDDRLVVRGDSDELSRAMTNLVANAVRHTPDGGAVRLVGERGPDGRVRVAVVDGCGGIDAADLPRMFDVGWRGSAHRTPGDGGAGLGLAIAQGVAEGHGGTVGVANVAGGCRFELTLPADGDRSPRAGARP